ncbi:hypothetical protein AB4144_15895, partial [Rhizobiaceae sp. 2RAB30]
GVSFQEMTRTGLLQTSYANETAHKEPAFDTAFAKAEAELDDKTRNEQFAALQRELWDRGGYIVWGIQTPLVAFSDRVGGFEGLAGANVGFVPSGLGDLWIKP